MAATAAARAHSEAISNAAKVILSRTSFIGDNSVRLRGHPQHIALRESESALKAMGFVFDASRQLWTHPKHDARALLDTALVTGHIVDKPLPFNLFNTPEQLSKRLVKAAQIRPTDRVLEPSAGSGALLRALPDNAEFCEIRESHFKKLKGTHKAVKQDLFDVPLDQRFDRIVAAPPLSDSQDARHVMRMLTLASPGGRVVALMTAQTHYRDDVVGADLIEMLTGLSTWEVKPLTASAVGGTGVKPAVCMLIADIKALM